MKFEGDPLCQDYAIGKYGFSRLTRNGRRARVRGEGFEREQVLPKFCPNDLERGTVP